MHGELRHISGDINDVEEGGSVSNVRLPLQCLSRSMKDLEILRKKCIGENIEDLQQIQCESSLPEIHGSIVGISKKGYAPYNPRKRNQDALSTRIDYLSKTRTILILDGHGESGELVSNFFCQHFHDELFSKIEWFHDTTDDMLDAIALTIHEIEHRILDDETIETNFSGSTLVFCAIRHGFLYIANIGDSRVTIGKRDGTAFALTVDHKPNTASEMMRILNAGGRVFAVEYEDGIHGPARVWLENADIPGLAMSRSLGDFVAHTAGVSSEPEFHIHKLQNDDHFMVVATDGLWEFISNQEAVTTIRDFIHQKNYENDYAHGLIYDPSTDHIYKSLLHRACLHKLLDEASRRWMENEQVVDDTTIALTFFPVPYSKQ